MTTKSDTSPSLLTPILTEGYFFSSIRRKVKNENSQAGYQPNWQDKVEAIIKGTAADLHGECDVYIRLRATVINFNMSLSRHICKNRWGVKGCAELKQRTGVMLVEGPQPRTAQTRSGKCYGLCAYEFSATVQITSQNNYATCHTSFFKWSCSHTCL